MPVAGDCRPARLVAADFDGDGHADMAAHCPDSDSVALWKGSGDGEFAQSGSLAVASFGSTGLVAADLNQDGVLDLAVSQFTGIAFFAGIGDGSFRPPKFLVGPSSIAALAAGDWNGDGKMDLAAASYSTLTLYLGLGDGEFGPPSPLESGNDGGIRDLRSADWNGDGIADLAAASELGIGVWYGSGAGAGTYRRVIPGNSRPLTLDVADLNADGVADVVVGNYYGGRISVYLGAKDGTYTVSMEMSGAGDIFGIAFADFDGDGVLDIVGTSNSSSSGVVALGLGGGKFASPALLGALFSRSVFRPTVSEVNRPAGTALLVMGRKMVDVLGSAGQPMAMQATRGYPMDGAFADFNRDGYADLVLVTLRSLDGVAGDDLVATLWIAAGLASGGLGPLRTLVDLSFVVAPGIALPAIVAGDFSGDGIGDFAFFNGSSGTLQLFVSKGDWSFTAGASLSGIATEVLTAADFDRDGLADVVSGAGTTARIHFTGPGGRFRETRSVTTCSYILGLLAGQFSGDAGPDLVAVCSFGMSLFTGAAGGEFSREVKYQMPAFRYGRRPAATAADFDGDGLLDVAVVFAIDDVWGGGMVFFSTPDGFYPPQGFPLAGEPVAVGALQWDGDGRWDLAVLLQSEAKVRIVDAIERRAP
ncbi:MAG: VCBS repeat-containing protein [Bryobacterales bacterium]|nr:VCBS repeat-containing protein [Bryobacterales bacterium]